MRCCYHYRLGSGACRIVGGMSRLVEYEVRTRMQATALSIAQGTWDVVPLSDLLKLSITPLHNFLVSAGSAQPATGCDPSLHVCISWPPCLAPISKSMPQNQDGKTIIPSWVSQLTQRGSRRAEQNLTSWGRGTLLLTGDIRYGLTHSHDYQKKHVQW